MTSWTKRARNLRLVRGGPATEAGSPLRISCKSCHNHPQFIRIEMVALELRTEGDAFVPELGRSIRQLLVLTYATFAFAGGITNAFGGDSADIGDLKVKA